MRKASKVERQIREFLANKLSLEELDDWSVDFSWNIHLRPDDSNEKELVYAVRGILSEFSCGFDEQWLREELELILTRT